MNYTMSFNGKTVLITGTAGGIGLECVKGYLENGATVFMVDFNAGQNNSQAADLEKIYGAGRVYPLTCDITKEEDVLKAVAFIKETVGALDILVNNAGTGSEVRSISESRENWDKIINLNLSSQFFFSQKIAEEFFIPQKKGKIVNMASLSSYFGVPNCVAYSSSKGALLQMTRSLAGEWARFNIQINCVCPGFVETPLITEKMQNEKWMDFMRIKIPQKRLAKPCDVVGSVLFLSSSLADYITGASIIVDGGYSC